MLENVIVNEHILEGSLYDYLFTVEEVNRRTLAGMPFRDAYKSVGIEVNEGRFKYSGNCTAASSLGHKGSLKASSLGHTHIGSLGNLCNESIKSKMASAADFRQPPHPDLE